MKLFFIMFIVLILLLIFSKTQKEGFLNNYCGTHKDCLSCAQSSGCSWCKNAKACLNSTSLKSTDKTCNQMNTISSSFLCNSVIEDEMPPDSNVSNDVMADWSLYKNKITDKIPPPNLYMNGDIKYSNEDVVSNANEVRRTVTNYQKDLPTIIANSVTNSIKPMVKGILSENYYIQGFEDAGANECKKETSCSSCVNNSKCGWDPQKLVCDAKGPNKLWYITQPTRCVLTSSTYNLMLTQPN
jgi:hypothetical protein